MVYLIPEEEARFSVHAATLPGVASQGDSEQKALTNIVKALEGVIAVYQKEGRPIPWLQTPQQPQPGAKTRWVIAHA
jgi:predicted RNase H-like HicB family nuclease